LDGIDEPVTGEVRAAGGTTTLPWASRGSAEPFGDLVPILVARHREQAQ